MERQGVEELLYQALETEIGGVEVYRTAIRCAQNEDLKEEWQKYGEETKRHVQIVQRVFQELGLDPERTTPGRLIVREKGQTLVAAMERALQEAPESAQLVAAECVVDAETKDHMNWELMGAVAEKLTGTEKKALKKAYDEVEDQEDEHLYHTMGWARELWLDTLGLPAELPPREEEEDVKSAMEEAEVKEERKEELKRASRPAASAQSASASSRKSSSSKASASSRSNGSSRKGNGSSKRGNGSSRKSSASSRKGRSSSARSSGGRRPSAGR